MSAPNLPSIFDAVIPHHPKDATMLPYVVTGLRQNAIGLRHIYVVSQEDPEVDDTTWVPEAAYPFTKGALRAHLPFSDPSSDGWYLQQLLKLYAHRAIPDALPNLLWFDSDILLAKPTAFVDASGSLLFSITKQNHRPYFEHAVRVLGPDGEKILADLEVSGISDHMLVRTDIVDALLSRVEERAANGRPAWEVLLDEVHPPAPRVPGMSEYEMFFNFALRNYPGVYSMRHLPVAMATGFGDIASPTNGNTVLFAFHSWYTNLG